MFSAPALRDQGRRGASSRITSSARDHDGPRILHVAPAYDEAIDRDRSSAPSSRTTTTIQFDNYAVSDSYLHEHEVVARAT